ncbi:hypothetical protein BC941DRAFT_441485 [Chlamydoabsidia padenii]|nr:hypothetical protein BC941DRAFT_441485 [Chlamydoabsidia padenii]
MINCRLCQKPVTTSPMAHWKTCSGASTTPVGSSVSSWDVMTYLTNLVGKCWTVLRKELGTQVLQQLWNMSLKDTHVINFLRLLDSLAFDEENAIIRYGLPLNCRWSRSVAKKYVQVQSFQKVKSLVLNLMSCKKNCVFKNDVDWSKNKGALTCPLPRLFLFVA